ncbi:MAG: hemerythrin domain-containing protein [Streptomyces sp.]|nr:hemerythrin domain-containing protein [Streptomyces sp.]
MLRWSSTSCCASTADWRAPVLISSSKRFGALARASHSPNVALPANRLDPGQWVRPARSTPRKVSSVEEPSGRESRAITETRLSHEMHRRATSLLLDAVDRDSVPAESLALFRDFVVTNLRHHHETEDAWLWPQILSASPETGHLLDELSLEHKRLEAALDRLAGAEVSRKTASNSAAPGGGPENAPRSGLAALRAAALEVRDEVHLHLEHEEPILFPALRDHITPDQWDEFSRRVIESSPTVAGHLTIGLFEEVGTPAEVQSALVNMPENLRPLIPAMRSQAAADLRVLRGLAS